MEENKTMSEATGENDAEIMEKPDQPEEISKKMDKKIKNLVAISILLFGLFLGSLFVDVSQLIRGSGYSQKNLSKSDIFEANGRTWVAYSEPAVPVTVISDDQCEKCRPDEVLVWLRQVMPTVSSEKVSYVSNQGKELISQFQIKTLPAFIFDQNVNKTELFTQAKELFEPNSGSYVLNIQALGLPAGKYLALPEVNPGDAVLGNTDAKVKVIIFSDFECPYCKLFYTVLRDTMKNYQDKVLFAFKEFPLDIHPEAVSASLAAQCALEQNKFWEYADILYAKQSEWGNAKNIVKFKDYARVLKLNAPQFNECLDSKKYQDKIDADKNEAGNFSITGTPTIFINDQVESGAITTDQLKTDIEAALSK
jgi:protein-disulfide isomerase